MAEEAEVPSFLPMEVSNENEVQQWMRSPLSPRERKFSENHRLELAKIESGRRRMQFASQAVHAVGREMQNNFGETLGLFDEVEHENEHLSPHYRQMLRRYSLDMGYEVGRFDAEILHAMRDVFKTYVGRDITPAEVVEYRAQASKVTFMDWVRSRFGANK